MGILISGFYRSGVQLLSNAINAGNGNVKTRVPDISLEEWDERVEFLGLNPKEKTTEMLQKLWDDPQCFVPCFLHPKHWEEMLFHEKDPSKIIIIYRPIEQVIDSVTREGIKQIYLRKKAFGRMRAMRKFNKILPLIQQNVKAAYIDYYQTAMSFTKNNPTKIELFKSAEFSNALPLLLEKINANRNDEILYNEDYFKPGLFTEHKAIETYRDDSLNEIHSYFTKLSSR